MSPRLPTKGTTTVDVHTRPRQDATATRPDTPARLDDGLPFLRTDADPVRLGDSTQASDLNAITPAPVLTVHEINGAISPVQSATPVNPALEHYRIARPPALPEVNADGVRVYKGRQYADLADDDIVQVVPDPATGLYRARLSSELTGSGPVLLRNTTTGRWHPLEDFEPITFPLSDERLQAFRSHLDFSEATPGADGLHRFDGKLYVEIDHHTYQVLHDPDASTPLASVMRIVRSEDPVASDSSNLYVATRPGRSEPIVFDAVEGWTGVMLPGAGGLPNDGGASVRLGLLDRLSLRFNRLRSPWSRARKVYRYHDDAQLAALMHSLGDDVTGALTRRETEYLTLKAELKSWLGHLYTTSGPGADMGVARHLAHRIKTVWRHPTETSLRLELRDCSLPALKTDFSHVQHLFVGSATWSDSANIFLSSFSGLRSLTVSRSTLNTLPDAITRMPNLSTLHLVKNQIRLTTQTAATLSGMSGLRVLSLSQNPLGKIPDFTHLTNLEMLALNETHMERWPTGVEHLRALTFLDLRDNHLTQVPPAFLSPSPEQFERMARINSVTLMEGNPFPADYWKKLEVFWQRVAADLPQLAKPRMESAFRLDRDLPHVVTVLQVYPGKTPAQAREYFTALGDDAEAIVARRVEELGLLDTRLVDYVLASRNDGDPINPPAQIQARRIARLIKACWLQNSGDTLKLASINGPLPALTADFSHVKTLELNAVTWTDAAHTFLANFPNLEHLSITQSRLGTLPGEIAMMGKLSRLDLSTNHLTLDEQGAATLSELRHLISLNLSDNPTLTLTPDFSNMPGLTYLTLNNTGIDRWPTGLLDKTELLVLDLRNNKLKEVPQALVNPEPGQLLATARINMLTEVTGNAFPSGYWKVFDDYWRRVHAAHPELLSPLGELKFDTGDSPARRYARLYPNKTARECREFVWSFDADTAITKLQSLEREFKTLKDQLDAWTFSGEGNRAGYVPANRLAVNAQIRPDRAEAKRRIISCWRRETPQKRANDETEIGLELNLSGLRLPALPDLDADFSHVGSLVLSNMNLSTSPEGFLTRFRHVRWLNLSQNQLRVLPPAIGQMNGMTRLYLHRNRLVLTADTANILAQRTSLRLLALQDNPRLGVIPDFSQISDLRVLAFANTGIDTFPSGIGAQPLLSQINLSNNRIRTLPDSLIAPSDALLPQSVKVANVTDIRNNPLSADTLDRLDAYSLRLAAAGTPLTGEDNLVATARINNGRVVRPAPVFDGMVRWTRGLSAAEIARRKIQWQTLRDQPQGDGFFNAIELLLDSRTGHNDLQARVWRLIDTITENTPESERLRQEIFDRAGEATCCDRAAFTFANLETRAMMHSALAEAGDKSQGPKLISLSRALFRLHEVDKIASADIARREATSPLNIVPAEVEIRLLYRYRLKDRLQLPAQPEQMGYEHLAHVTKAQLDAAYEKVIALDNSPEEFQELVSRDFWQKFLTNKYQEEFEMRRQPIQDRQAALDEAHEAKTLSDDDYKAQSIEVQASWMIEEAALIETMTRRELAEPSAGNAGEQATGAST
ncbi:MAG TPA: NEL-type E3 ubiquitin ligase domain-containing protein [Pseudomonas sp.]|uniref:NEL-type E3 ubiquitin ligase domain-containing protein n=1 Tax=Pseudomonas sp. TaxID=306 RepID=UPI002BEE9C62|nr:NEL-type E3 ubiquitin ligase domain-containing protein [Pseudomonas sp.]HWH85780.1 NEL-type E3 ubiquitin ligase domain-containing protein [Pseudomonas sp.]